MPIFEYECRGCGNQFELLVLPNRESAAICPQCQGKDLERMPTSFGFSSAELSQQRIKKARAINNASKDNKDKQVAEREHFIEHVNEHRERVKNEK